jgi:hypothetical protein
MDRVVLTMPKINPTCVCITILTEPAGWDVLPKARAFWCVCVCCVACMVVLGVCVMINVVAGEKLASC